MHAIHVRQLLFKPFSAQDLPNRHRGRQLEVAYEKLNSYRVEETLTLIRVCIQTVRTTQRERSSMFGHQILCPGEIQQYYKLHDEAKGLMRAAITQLNLSTRAAHRIPKLPHDGGFGGVWRIPIYAFRRGTAIPAKFDVDLAALYKRKICTN